MTTPLFHVAAGMVLAAIISLPRIIERWPGAQPLYRLLRSWCMLALILGAWFAIPSLIAKTGIAGGPLTHWAWNIFGFHALIDDLWPHTTILGVATFTGLMAVHYLAIVAAIIRAKQRRRAEISR